MIAGLQQRDLETVVPRTKGASVLVVRGEFAGQRGRLLEVCLEFATSPLL